MNDEINQEQKLPRARSEEYFKFLNRLTKDLEAALPIRVYGFTDYSHISYYWYTDRRKANGELVLGNYPNSMPFSRALRIAYPDKQFNAQPGDYVL